MASKGNTSLMSLSSTKELEDYNKYIDSYGDWISSSEHHPNERVMMMRESTKQEEAETIEYLTENTSLNEEDATKLLKTLKELGYDQFYMEDEEFVAYFDNQALLLDSSVLSAMHNGELIVTPEQFFKYYAKDYPEIFKYYGGAQIFYGDDQGESGHYDPGNDVIIYDSFSIFDKKDPWASSGYKNVMEHEGTHKVDYLSGESYTTLSDHPYFKKLSEEHSASEYARGFKNNPEQEMREMYHTENLACSVMPLGTAISNPTRAKAQDSTPGSGKVGYVNGSQYTIAGDISYEEHVRLEPELDHVARLFRESKTPREWLDKMDALYLERYG